MAALEAGLVLDDLRFPWIGIPGTRRILSDGPAHPHRGGADVGTVGGTELSDSPQMCLAVEGADPAVGHRDGFED